MGQKFKVVRIDENGSSASMVEEKSALAGTGAILEGYDCVTEDEIIIVAHDADVIITAEAIISSKVIEALPDLRAIIRYGVGFDTVDVNAATKNNVLVVNVPDFCLEEVSNHVIMFILAQCKKMIPLNNMVKSGLWEEAKRAQIPMSSVHGETLGIIGCGKIGCAVAKKALEFKMHIIGHDKYLSREITDKAGIKLVSFEELLKQSDYLTLHVPLTPETHHMLSKEEFRQMKLNAVVINTSRGKVIDEQALIMALRNNKIAGACLDVFEPEPIVRDNPLLKMENVITMPHSASYSDSAFKRLAESVGLEASRIAKGQMPKNIVNKI